jgi:intein/homing endonuclease
MSGNEKFGLDFQRQVIKQMLQDERFAARCVAYLEEGYFSQELRWFFRKFKDLYTEHNSLPTRSALSNEINKQGATDASKYYAEFKKIQESEPDENYLKKELTGFIRASLFILAYKEAAPLYNSGNREHAYEITKKHLDLISKVDFEKEKVASFGDHVSMIDLASAQAQNAIPTGIAAIDAAMNGGLFPQTWTTFLGGSNTGKCLGGDSLVPTDKGLVKIKDITLSQHNYVVGYNAKRKILAVHRNGIKPLYRMTLSSGLYIDSTLDHIHALDSGDGIEQKQLRDISVGDPVVVPIDNWIGTKKIPNDIAWLLGFTFGDGSYFKNSFNTRYLSWAIHKDSSVKNKLLRVLGNMGLNNPRTHKKGDNGESIWANAFIADQLEAFGLRTGTKENKCLIDVLSWSKESAAAYIAGIMDADGTVDKRGSSVVLSLHYEHQVRYLQQVLLRLGYVSNVKSSHKTVKLKNRTLENYGVYSIFVTGRSSRRLIKELSLTDKWGDGRLEKAVGRENSKLGGEWVYYSDEASNLLPSETKKKLQKKRPNSGLWRILANTAESDGLNFDDSFHRDEVVSIEYVGEQETFDLSVDGDNLFVANGILTHNSMLMPNLAYFAVNAGKKVFLTVHEDEELPTKLRFLSRFSGVPFTKLMAPYTLLNQDEKEALKIADELLKENVKIRYMYSHEATVEQVQQAARMLHKEWPFELFLCDYGQCLTTSRFKSLDNTRLLQEFVYSELKQLCLELNVAGAGGAQVNRLGHQLSKKGTDYLRMSDVAESFGIVRKASNVITINRSEDDAKKNRIVFLLDKVRNGRCPVAVECVTDYNRCIVYTQFPGPRGEPQQMELSDLEMGPAGRVDDKEEEPAQASG